MSVYSLPPPPLEVMQDQTALAAAAVAVQQMTQQLTSMNTAVSQTFINTFLCIWNMKIEDRLYFKIMNLKRAVTKGFNAGSGTIPY